jgi:Domain of unknown function (DUF5666)
MRLSHLLWTACAFGSLILGASAQTNPRPARPCDTAPVAVQQDSLDLPPLPKGQVSLIGGTVIRLDPVRDKITLRAFGGRDLTIHFDVRTCVTRGETLASMRDVKAGMRVYADTILNDGRIFAKTVRVSANSALGESQGQITSYDPNKRILRVRDAISSRGFDVQITANTEIRADGQPVQAAELRNGALVKVVFKSGADTANLAEKIDLLAQKGGMVTFSGKILSIDLRNGYVTLVEPESQNTFDVGLDSIPEASRNQLKEGADVTVRARFDGTKYQAESVEPIPSHP